MLYYAEAELDVDGGIQITGSHNPANYNGFKMVLFGGAFFGADIQKLGRMAAAGDWEKAQRQRLRRRRDGPLCRSPAAGFRRRRLPDRLGRRQRRGRPGRSSGS
jgi:phosphomannomutase